MKELQFLHQSADRGRALLNAQLLGRPRYHRFAQRSHSQYPGHGKIADRFHTDKEIGISLSVFRIDIISLAVVRHYFVIQIMTYLAAPYARQASKDFFLATSMTSGVCQLHPTSAP